MSQDEILLFYLSVWDAIIVCDNRGVSVCVCRPECVRVCVWVSGHMLSHTRLSVLNLACSSVCVGMFCVCERGWEITAATANFKVSAGVVPGQHVYT